MACGRGELLAVDPSGAWTSWVDDPLIANGIDIAFAPSGPFGEGVDYVADAFNEPSWR